MKYVMIVVASAMVFASSCKEPREPHETKANKEIKTFTITKMVKDRTHKIASNNLKALVSSGNGEFVYAVTDQKAGLRVLEVDQGLWHDALEWDKVKRAHDRSVVNIANEAVGGFDTYIDGILFTVDNDRGLVILKGFGVDNASLYEQNPATNFKTGKFVPMLVTKKDKSHYIYLFPHKVVAKNRVLFRTYVEPPKADNATAPQWDRTLKKTAALNLDTILFARTQDNESNLLIADKDGIKRVMEPDLGATGKTLDNSGNAVYEAAQFMLDGKTKNEHVNTMQLIDEKLLVVGLKSTDPNNGGVAVADLSEKTVKWRHFGKGLGLSVDYIAPERLPQRDKTKLAAIITTDKGLLFMDNEGNMMEPGGEGKGHLVTVKTFNDNRAESTKYDDAKDGFLGDRVPATASNYLSAAQDKTGMWYLGFKGKSDDDGGIFKLDIRIDQVEPPTPPPTLP